MTTKKAFWTNGRVLDLQARAQDNTARQLANHYQMSVKQMRHVLSKHQIRAQKDKTPPRRDASHGLIEIKTPPCEYGCGYSWYCERARVACAEFYEYVAKNVSHKQGSKPSAKYWRKACQ